MKTSGPSANPDVPGQPASTAAEAAGPKLVSPAQARGDSAATLRNAVAGTGKVRVIVTMSKSIKVEADLSKSQVAAQRAAIADSLDGLDAVLAGTSSNVLTRFKITPAAVVNADSAGLEALLADSSVAAVTLDRELQLTLDSSTGVIDSDLLNATGVLGNGYDGSSGGAFEVAVLDTGVDNTHTAFTGRIVAQACFSTGPWCPDGTDQQIGGNAGDDCNWSTQCDHGTHVGGISSGAVYTNGHEGVARGSRIIAVQIGHRVTGAACSPSPSPCWRTFFSDMDQALQHVLNLKNGGRNVAAVNLSIGGGGPSNNCDAALPNSQNLMTNLRAANVAVVVAAGNDGFNNGVSQPGCLTSAFTISATDDADVPAFFTNSGTKTNWWAPGVSIVAPVPSAVAPHDDEGSKSGTSMSTPHVAGGFALLRECVDGNGVGLTTNAIASRLNATGVDVTRNAVTRKRINVLDAATGTVNNNDFANPETLPAGGNFNDFDFTVCSDTEPGEPGPFSLDNGIWYQWTPASTGTITISTDDGGGNVTTFDTTLAVYTGNSLGSLSLVASDDDSGVGLRSLVTFPVNGGTTYRIKVDGFAAANGLLNLHIGALAAPPTCQGVPATRVGTGFSDVINGTAGADVIVAGAGDDTVSSMQGNDRVCGDAGNDSLTGGQNDDVIFGGAGADFIDGSSGDDFLVGNPGGGSADDLGDTIKGGPGNDWLDGWVGDDVLDGQGGNDTLRGEDGIDTVTYANSPSGIDASLLTNTATGWGNDTFVEVENLTGSAFADELIGNSLPNILIGNGRADDIEGRSEIDEIFGGPGNDLLRGGSNQDRMKGGNGADVMNGDDGADRVSGDKGEDTVNGGDKADIVRGGKFDDVVKGGEGGDDLFGESGNDALNGGPGPDNCNGGTQVDTGTNCEVIVSIP